MDFGGGRGWAEEWAQRTRMGTVPGGVLGFQKVLEVPGGDGHRGGDRDRTGDKDGHRDGPRGGDSVGTRDRTGHRDGDKDRLGTEVGTGDSNGHRLGMGTG